MVVIRKLINSQVCTHACHRSPLFFDGYSMACLDYNSLIVNNQGGSALSYSKISESLEKKKDRSPADSCEWNVQQNIHDHVPEDALFPQVNIFKRTVDGSWVCSDYRKFTL